MWGRKREPERVMPQYASQIHGAPAFDDDEPYDEPKGKRGLGWHLGIWLTLIFVGAMFGTAIVWILKFVDASPSAGQTNLAQMQKAAAPTPVPESFLSGRNFSFSYPGVFNQLSNGKPTARSQEQYSIGSKNNYRRNIMVDVRTLPSGLLDDDSSYRLRTSKPAEYTPTRVQIGGAPAVIMSTADKSEKTLFCVHKGTIITVAVMTTAQGDDIEAFMKTIQTTMRLSR